MEKTPRGNGGKQEGLWNALGKTPWRVIVRLPNLFIILLSMSACGGGSGSKDTNTASDVKVRPTQQLQGISKDLQAKVDDIIKPLDEVDGLLLHIEELPTRVNVDLSSLAPLFQAAISGGDTTIPDSLRLDLQAKKEVEAVVQRFKAIVNGLKSTPEKLKELSTKIVKVLPEIPILAAQVLATSKVVMANPFASAEAKAQAQADMAALTQIQTDVQNKVKDIQKKVLTLPQKAKSALSGLAAVAKGTVDLSSVRASLPDTKDLVNAATEEVTAVVTGQGSFGAAPQPTNDLAAGGAPGSVVSTPQKTNFPTTVEGVVTPVANTPGGASGASSVCLRQCDTLLASCVQHQAPACPTFKRPTGRTAELLGQEPPIDGIPWMLSEEPPEVCVASCQELTAPCAQVNKTCAATCEGQTSKAKIRIFADRGRSLVYLDEKRLGATPEDQLQPFDANDVEVGKHWLRLVSVDNLWQWRGFVDVDSRADNVFEVILDDAVQAHWKRAQDLESKGFIEAAIVAYDEFAQNHPKESRKARTDKKIRSLKRKLTRSKKTLVKRFSTAEQLDDRVIALAEYYLLLFPDGHEAANAQSTIASAQLAISNRAHEQQIIDKIHQETNLEMALKLTRAYLQKYPSGFFVSEAKQTEADIENKIAARLEEKEFASAMRQRVLDEKRQMLTAYLERYPEGVYSEQAKVEIQKVDQQKEKDTFMSAGFAATDSVRRTIYERYLELYPQGHYASKAKDAINEINKREEQAHLNQEKGYLNSVIEQAQNAQSEKEMRNALGSCDTFIAQYPDSNNAPIVKDAAKDVQKRLDDLLEQERRKAIGRPQRIAGITLWSLGGALGVTGLIVGGVAYRDRNDLANGCSDSSGNVAICDDAYVSGMEEDIKTKALVGDIFIWTGVAAVAGGVLLHVLAPSWEEQEKISHNQKRKVVISAAPHAGGDGASILFQGAF